MKTWTTQNGEEIPYKKLSDTHLENIINYVQKRAKELDGKIITVEMGWGGSKRWAITGTTEEWLKNFDYKGLLKEKKRREKLLKNKHNYDKRKI